MRKIGLLCAAALLAALTACSAAETESTASTPAGQSAGQSAAAAQAAAGSEAGPLTLLQGSDGWSYGAAGANGFYFVSAAARSDGSTSLLYCDYDTMQQVVLCSQPNCAHNTAACSGYLPYSAGGVLVEVVGQKLLLFYPGSGQSAENAVLPHIEMMGLDGSDRAETAAFAANQEFLRPMATDGTVLYAILWETTGNDTASFLARIDPAAGTCEKLLPADSTWLKGVVGNALLLKSAAGDTTEWFTYHPATGEETVLHTEPSGAAQPATVFGRTLVYQKGSRLHLLDLSTGQDTELTGYEVPDQTLGYVNLYYADDGRLLFEQCSNPGVTTLPCADGFYVLEGDKAPAPWALTHELYGEATACAVAAEKDTDTYLVVAGVQDAASVQADDGTSGYIAADENRYALISKADYWAGIDNFRFFS